MLELLWGLKTTALFDVWSIEHVLSGLSVGASTMKHNKNTYEKKTGNSYCHQTLRHFDIIAVLGIAYLWETIEHYLEIGLAGPEVAYWFQGEEFWANRIITDPLMMVLGYIIVSRYPKLVWPARVASLVWLLTHIFAFPHSMYLHELF